MVTSLVSVIVVNWNGKEYLAECLDSLMCQTYPSREVIVVDNGSVDGSLELLKWKYAAHVKLIENDRNYGFTKAVNQGILSAKGEYIALLNNDAVADKNWLAELVSGIAREEDVGMAASKILFYFEPDLIDKVGHLMYPDGLNAGRGLGEKDMGQYDRIEEVLFPDGCAALYRRRMLEDVGLFDEQFFAYGDDAELGMRARLRGWRCLYIPEAIVYHVHSGSLGRHSPEKVMLVERNRLWLAVKCWPLPLLLISPIFTLIRFFWHAYSALSGRGSAGAFSRHHSKATLLAALLRAYLSGIKGLPEVLGKRKRVRAERRISDREFYRLLRRFRISARELALRER